MRTDDPGTPGNKNFEVNVALTADRRIDKREFEAPLLDINYGVGDTIQLKFEVPYVVDGADGAPTRSGLGNSLAGVKWRFLESKQHDFEISTYPQLEFNNPTSSVDRGLAERGIRVLLPVEATKKIGPVNLNVEAGYAFRQHTSDEWLTGLVLGRQLSNRVEMMGELYTVRELEGEQETTIDVGSRVKLRDSVVLLLMAGRSLRGGDSREPQFIGYGGLQWLFSLGKKK